MSLPSESRAKINAILDDSTEKPNGIPGIIYVAVDKHGHTIYKGAAGVRSLDKRSEKMTTDTVAYIASCTKLVTAIACMQLVEQGKVTLDDPNVIEQTLPEVASAKIIEGTKGNFTFRTPKNKVTLRMLLNHSANFSYTFFDEKIRDYMASQGDVDEFSGVIDAYRQPLVGEPGEDWRYGIGLDWAGVLVERVTGLKLGEYFKKFIFDPLEIETTHFAGGEFKFKDRLTGMHSRNVSGVLESRDHFPLMTSASFHSGGAGLQSSAPDYVKILTCFLNDGVGSNGARILKPETVQMMLLNSLAPEITPKLDNPVVSSRPHLSNTIPDMQPGSRKGWGISFLINEDELPTGRSAGSAYWAGIANCYYTIDTKKGIATMVITQILPFGDLEVLTAWMTAETELYKGLGL